MNFEGLKDQTMLTEPVINWVLRWWSGQVNGSFGKNPPPPQTNPDMPRCYFADSYWYSRMVGEDGFSYDNIKRWTNPSAILQNDLILIPIHIPARTHWALAVIDFNRNSTVVYDSFEQDVTRNTLQPAHPEIHDNLLAWLACVHQDQKSPFHPQAWKTINPFSNKQPTPQQGTRRSPGVHCGVFVLAFAMYLSTNRPLQFGQSDIPSLRNWIVATMIHYGMGNNTFAPLRDTSADGNMARWTSLMRDYSGHPPDDKRKGGDKLLRPRKYSD